MKSLPNFAEIVGVPDGDLQRALARAPDVILAAALLGAPDDVARKIILNLSERRRAEVAAAVAAFSERSREVARRVLVKAAFGIEDEETKAALAPVSKEEPSGRGKELRNLLEKMATRHPDFVEARRRRSEEVWTEHLRKLFGGA